jgi:hypothetical protein
VTSAIVFGTGTGAALGVLMIASVLLPRRVSLAEVLAVRDVPALAAPVEVETAGWAARLGRPLVPLLATVGLPRAGLSADLELCGGPVSGTPPSRPPRSPPGCSAQICCSGCCGWPEPGPAGCCRCGCRWPVRSSVPWSSTRGYAASRPPGGWRCGRR